jgi:hypothetical protein
VSLSNPWKALQDLLAGPSLQVGKVVAIEAGLALVELPGGGRIRARGVAVVGRSVFVRGDLIEGEAPEVPVVNIEI